MDQQEGSASRSIGSPDQEDYRNTRHTARDAQRTQSLANTNICDAQSTIRYESSVDSMNLDNHAIDHRPGHEETHCEEAQCEETQFEETQREETEEQSPVSAENMTERGQDETDLPRDNQETEIPEDQESEPWQSRSTFQEEMDKTGNNDMSVQMYRYLQHNNLKGKIIDLCEREQHFVVKQAWDEALRLREMRNALILLQNKNLYENHDLEIDDDSRCSGLKIIQAREKLNNNRIKLSDTSLYSDEAKDLWEQWVREDDQIAELETNVMRDLFTKGLEDEWKNLAIRDKNRVCHLYDGVMNKSSLQDEHKLAAILRSTNTEQECFTTPPQWM